MANEGKGKNGGKFLRYDVVCTKLYIFMPFMVGAIFDLPRGPGMQRE